jgi:hypothetical protein
VNDDFINIYRLFLNSQIIFGKLKKINDNSQYMKNNLKFECKICNIEFSSKKLLKKHILLINDEEHSNNWVECSVCGFRSTRIDFHLKNKHNINIEQYELPYLSKNYIKKIKNNGSVKHEKEKYIGNRNHFFGKHHTKETKQKISQTLLNKRNIDKYKKTLLEQDDTFHNQQDSLEDIFNNYKNKL